MIYIYDSILKSIADLSIYCGTSTFNYEIKYPDQSTPSG